MQDRIKSAPERVQAYCLLPLCEARVVVSQGRGLVPTQRVCVVGDYDARVSLELFLPWRELELVRPTGGNVCSCALKRGVASIS
jgi:hypothetical protein